MYCEQYFKAEARMDNTDIGKKNTEDNLSQKSSEEKTPLIDMKTLHEAVIMPHSTKHDEQPTVSAYIDPVTDEFIQTDNDE